MAAFIWDSTFGILRFEPGYLREMPHSNLKMGCLFLLFQLCHDQFGELLS